jgi:glycerophosphoryl diester phosphodiesterase
MNASRARPPEVIGHGGGGGDLPQNSRLAIEAGISQGADRIEVDVRLTGDATLVLMHDETVRVRDRAIPVRRLTIQELRALVPDVLTLDEAVELIGGRAPLLLDIKQAGYEVAVIAAVQCHRLAPELVVSSTHAETLRRLRQALPSIRIGLSTGHLIFGAKMRGSRALRRTTLRIVIPLPLVMVMHWIEATETMLHHQVATRPLVTAFHRRGWRVNVWTVDRPEAITRAITLGVDGIITNRPDLVRAAIAVEAD